MILDAIDILCRLRSKGFKCGSREEERIMKIALYAPRVVQNVVSRIESW